jgi:adenine C2-methylase RlmN of 23S rRNA A2503 and tRNA A37
MAQELSRSFTGETPFAFPRRWAVRLGCPFCLSGSRGLLRNLSAEEIYSQYKLLKDKLPIKRIAMSGIGEPLMNYANVHEAFWMLKEEGLKGFLLHHRLSHGKTAHAT